MGCFHESANALEALSILRNSGCRVVELNSQILEHIGNEKYDQIIATNLAGFEYVSMHADVFEYGKPGTAEILKEIEHLNHIRQLDLVVFHPDIIFDFGVLANIDLKVGIENMDHNKKSFRSVEDIKDILDRFPKFGFVLDVNHILTNDPTLKSVSTFFDVLGGKIVQYHLSGYKTLHDPLFKTKQVEIIQAMQIKNLPIIVESLLAPEDIVRERNYILENL